MSAPAPKLGQDEERTILDHFGLPFYYRHTPPLAMRRGSFWTVFLLLVLIICLNTLYMPYDKGTYIFSLRRLLFGGVPAYPTFADGALAIFNQLFVIAMILSGIVAPLYATFSLGGERISGTLEFLRLAPFSPTAIVMGKMFATVFPVHLISGAFLSIGMVFGWLGGVPPPDLFFAVLAIVLSSATLHAAGAYLAAQTVSFRGFGAVVGLLGLGFLFYFLPMAAQQTRQLSFLAYLSPWGTMDGAVWKSFHPPYRYAHASQFMGWEALVAGYVLLFHAALFGLLVWAASRKLDAPERPALPSIGWLLMWGLVLGTALGVVPNESNRGPSNSPREKEEWIYAAVILIIGGLTVCFLALIDHPHRRELALADACERHAGRETHRAGRFRVFQHAFFVMLLTLLTTVLAYFFLDQGKALIKFPTDLAVFLVLAPGVVVLLVALILETSALRFTSFLSQSFAAGLLVVLLLAGILVPIIDCGVAYSRWQTCLWTARDYQTWVLAGKPPQSGGRGWSRDANAQMRRLQDPIYESYLAHMNSLEEIAKQEQQFAKDPIWFFWEYHPEACLSYVCVFLVLAGGLLLLRWRTYEGLNKEARRAILSTGPPPSANLVVVPTQESSAL